MRTTKIVGLILALMLPVPAWAQADDEAAVRAVVDRLFDAMRAADSAGVRSVLHPKARLISVTESDGQPTIEILDSMDGFINAVGTAHEETWDERIWDVEVRIDGRLATVWANYAFYVGDRLSHCGVDAFQLFNDVDGWKIFEIADTRRREGCEPPPTG